jgi:hypothetical protein
VARLEVPACGLMHGLWGARGAAGLAGYGDRLARQLVKAWDAAHRGGAGGSRGDGMLAGAG